MLGRQTIPAFRNVEVRGGNAQRLYGRRAGGHQPEALNAIEVEMVVQSRIAMPREAVGVVLRLDGKATIRTLRNTSPDTGKFVLSDSDVLALYRQNMADPGSVLVLWHSHPEETAVPSRMDRLGHPLFIPRMALVLPESSEVHYFARKAEVDTLAQDVAA